MKIRIQQTGKALALHIPPNIAQLIHITDGSEVEVTLEGNRIIVSVPNTIYLDELLSRITPENLHSEIATGEVMGNEVW
jgi:antitoxin MazE